MSGLVTIPQVEIAVGGAALPDELARSLGEIEVRQRLSMPAQVELTLLDVAPGLDGHALFTPGAALHLAVAGWREPLFAGEITAVEHSYGADHGHEVRVRGYDLLHRLRKRQEVRAHIQVNAAELAQEFAAALGLAVHVADAGPVWQRLYQHDHSDLALLVDVAARTGLYLTVEENALHLITLAGMGTALPLTLGETLFEARIEVNADPACRQVTTTGWDPLRVEAHSGRATTARSDRPISSAAEPGRVGGDGHRKLVGERTPTDDHAQALAQAELDRRLAGEVMLWGVAAGSPQLRPGARIEVAGVAPSLAGRYVLTEVHHQIDAERGYISELSTAPPAIAPRSKEAVATLGIVTAVDDPQRVGRIRVALPAYGNVESDWLGMLSIGGGAGKGLVILPDVGDRVLVLLLHGEPGEGVILGGLFGMDGPPDSGVENGAVRRYTLQTPGGQRLRLDDSERSVRFENKDGSFVELAPGKVRVHAATDLELEAPGRAIVIRGRSVDFQQG